MCGIVGFVTAEGKKGQLDRVDFLTQGLIVDILRGEDSTGVLYGHAMKEKMHGGYVKSAADGYTFVNGKDYKESIANQKELLRYAVGHNRAATLGSVSLENAHPFAHSDVIGLHNGTVRGGMTTMPITQHKSGCKVDSDCIMMNLNHVDPADAGKEVISKITGAYMLVWYDKRDGSLNFARNDTRSFHMCQSYNDETVFFASEALELQWLMERNRLSGGEIMHLEPGHQLKFTDDNGVVPEVHKFEVYAAPKAKPATVTPTGAGTKTTSPAAGGKVTSNGPGKGDSKGYSWTQLDNRVNAGGKRRAVPKLLQTELESCGLVVRDRLQFKPMAAQAKETLRNPNAPGFVTGYLDSIGMNAVIHRVEPATMKNCLKRTWTVRPVAVNWTDKVHSTGVVVCEVVATVEMPEVLTKLGRNSSTTSTEDSKKGSPAGYKDHKGSAISKAVWEKLVSKGCVVCEKPITPEMKAELRWDLVSEEPQCPECAAADDAAIDQIAERHGDYYGNSYH